MKLKKYLLLTLALIQLFGFFAVPQAQAQVECKAEIAFDINPKNTTLDGTLTMSGWVRSTQFNSQGSGSGEGYCYYGSTSRSVIKEFRVRIIDKANPNKQIIYFDVPLTQYSTNKFNFSTNNLTARGLGYAAGANVNFAARVEMYALGTPYVMTESAPVAVTVIQQSYACIAGDGKYACGKQSNCTDVPNNACAGKPCNLISSSLCGQTATNPGDTNPKTTNPEDTNPKTTNPGDTNPTPSTNTFDCKNNFDPKKCIYNPLPEDELTNMFLFIAKGFLIITAIWGVMFIIIGGFRMVMAAGNEEDYIAAKKTITWAILGVVITMLSFSIIAIVQNILSVDVIDTVNEQQK